MRFFMIVILASILSVSTLSPLGVQAEDGGQDGMRVRMRNTSSTERQMMGTTSSEWRGRCKMMENKIDTRVDMFDQNKEHHVAAYQNLKTQISQLIVRLESRGLDTTKLSEDLVVFDAKVKKMAIDYATYIAALKEAKATPCGTSQGEFKQKLQTVRGLLKVVHQDAMDIRTYYRETIRTDIKALKSQIREDRSTTTRSSR